MSYLAQHHPQIAPGLKSKTTAFNQIPIIDVAPLLDGSQPQKVAEQLADVCENIGFLYIKNHGIDKQLVQAMFRLTKAFFDRPMAEKQSLNIIHSGPTLRGYIPMFGENVNPEKTVDVKEVFDYGQHSEEISPFFGPNLMPATPSEFKPIAERYHAAMLELGRKLVSGIALSLGLPKDYFAALQQKPITIQRLLHYPPQRGMITEKEFGIGEHTDYGFLTILAQDEVGGLQVQNAAGEWISAPPIEDTFIVNMGDLVQTFSNDKYTSTLHRVVNTTGKERYSIPFFLDLDFDAVVEVVPTCQSADNPAKYQPYICGQHKYQRFVDSYTHLK